MDDAVVLVEWDAEPLGAFRVAAAPHGDGVLLSLLRDAGDGAGWVPWAVPCDAGRGWECYVPTLEGRDDDLAACFRDLRGYVARIAAATAARRSAPDAKAAARAATRASLEDLAERIAGEAVA